MKKFFFSHPDIILTIIAFVLLAILIAFFSWGINDVIFEVHNATISSDVSSAQGFNLQDASSIKLRGIATGTVATPTLSNTITPTSTAAPSFSR